MMFSATLYKKTYNIKKQQVFQIISIINIYNIINNNLKNVKIENFYENILWNTLKNVIIHKYFDLLFKNNILLLFNLNFKFHIYSKIS